MQTKRFGVIGLGVWGERHVQTYAEHPHCELAALCDTNEERLKATGEKYGAAHMFTDYREMLALDGLDAVSIVTPDFAHKELAVAAMEAGKHVLIEKPLATTLDDCERMREAREASGVKFMVDFHNRWNPGVADMKARIAAGEVGRPLMCYYRLNDNIYVPTEMLSWAGRSTVNWFLGSHCVDTLLWLFDDEVARVFTVTRSTVLKGMGIDTPDFYNSIIEFRGGGTAMLENCWIMAAGTPRLFDVKCELVAEKGSFFFSGGPDALEVFTPAEAVNVDTAVCPVVHGRAVGFGIESIRHFAQSVCTDTEPIVGIDEGIRTTRVLLAMDESARTGQPVELGS